MVAASDIVDRDTLQAWLQGRSREDAVCIAHRAAMRHNRTIRSMVDTPYRQEGNAETIPSTSALLALRCLLISGVAYRGIAPEIEAAAASAAAAQGFSSAGLSAAYASPYSADLFDRRDFSEFLGYEASGSNMLSLKLDCLSLENHIDPMSRPLWNMSVAGPTQEAWISTRSVWEKSGEAWAFWLEWYENAIEGKPQNWPLLTKVALIPREAWEAGPDRLHFVIKQIVYDPLGASNSTLEVNEDLTALPLVRRSTIEQVRNALMLNQTAMPPTFDAIEGFITLEIARLQSRNYQSDDEAEESRRMIRTLVYLLEAMSQIRTALPTEGPISDVQATKVAGLSRLYMNRLSDLPRSKVDEVVDGVWSVGRGACQIGLVGCSAALMVSVGLPALASVAAATLVFAPRLGSDAIKAAVEIAKSQAKP